MTADFLSHEFQRIALRNAESSRRTGGGDGDTDGDFVSFRKRGPGKPRQREGHGDRRGG